MGWSLHIHLDNNEPGDDTHFKLEVGYSSANSLLLLDTLKFQIRSPCNASNTGVSGFASIANKTTGDIQFIDAFPSPPGGCTLVPPACGSSYNGEGAYNGANGNFFIFYIDLRVPPLIRARIRPGLYSATLKICLHQESCP